MCQSLKDNVKAPPQTPQSTSSSTPPTSDDARPYVFIRGKLFDVPEAYPKGAEGRLVNDKRFIRELEELLAWPLELGLGTLNPRFIAWPLELGSGTLNPHFIAWPLKLGLGTRNPSFFVWPLEFGLGTPTPHGSRFSAFFSVSLLRGGSPCKKSNEIIMPSPCPNPNPCVPKPKRIPMQSPQSDGSRHPEKHSPQSDGSGHDMVGEVAEFTILTIHDFPPLLVVPLPLSPSRTLQHT